jgi:pantetheine-phosphate adenylyltransferase
MAPIGRRAVYAGSFDPPTNGHLWMVEQGSRLFDKLVVAIGVNPDKRCLFSLEERLAMLREATAGFPNVEVASFENLFLVHYAQRAGAGFILRGIRNEDDYAYERGMRYVNAELGAGILSVFLMPPREYAEVSSSFVKGLVGPEGWQQVVARYVPPGVFRSFVQRHAAAHGDAGDRSIPDHN